MACEAPDQSSGSGGFTLLELMVVVFVLALLVGLVPPMIAGAVPGAELRSATQEIAAALRYARSQAISENREVTFELDVKNRSYRLSGSARKVALPGELKLSLYGAASESPDDEKGGIRFFNDGSSTGGRIVVARGDSAYTVDVDWLLGRVRVDD